MASNDSVSPILPKDFGQSVHIYQQFTACVSGRVKEKALEDPKLWVHIARSLVEGCEVRVLADDMSYRAELICVYRNGSDVRMKLISYTPLEAVDYDALDAVHGDYEVKQRGIKKWCIIKKSTGEYIKEGMATQAAAYKELEDYKKMLAA